MTIGNTYQKVTFLDYNKIKKGKKKCDNLECDNLRSWTVIHFNTIFLGLKNFSAVPYFTILTLVIQNESLVFISAISLPVAAPVYSGCLIIIEACTTCDAQCTLFASYSSPSKSDLPAITFRFFGTAICSLMIQCAAVTTHLVWIRVPPQNCVHFLRHLN